MILKFIRSLIERKIKQLYYEQKMIMEDMKFWSIPRMSSAPPVITFGYIMRNFTLKICDMKIAMLEAILGEGKRKN